MNPMKTMKLFPLLAVILFLTSMCSISAIAGTPVLATPVNIQKIIKESIKYPEQALKNGCCGSVDVTFLLTDKGTIEIKSMSTDNEEIAKSVKEQFKDITFSNLKPVYNQQYRVKITFKLI